MRKTITCYNVKMKRFKIHQGTVLHDEWGTPIFEDDGKKFYNAGTLYNADPDCDHVLDPFKWSGIKCFYCEGWFCY